MVHGEPSRASSGCEAIQPGLAPNVSLNQQSSVGGAAKGSKEGKGIAAESKCYLYFVHPSLRLPLALLNPPSGRVAKAFSKND